MALCGVIIVNSSAFPNINMHAYSSFYATKVNEELEFLFQACSKSRGVKEIPDW